MSLTPEETEDLRALVDDASLIFVDSTTLELVWMDGGKRVALGSWRLSDIVDAALEVMQTEQEADDMIDLSRHLTTIAKRIRNVTDDYNQPRGD